VANGETAIVTTESFGAIERQRNAEVASIAMAAKVKANIEAACIMAERHPRDMLQVRAQLLQECERPRFAEKARYSLPRTKYNPDTNEREKVEITGFSIRFAEAALRHMGNMSGSSEVVYEDDEKLTIAVTVRDYERNAILDDVVLVSKTTERSFLRRGDNPISSRTNSQGKPVYTLAATVDEITQRKNQLVSKSLRTLVLRLLPADIKEECEERCIAIGKDKFAKDPNLEIKRVVDSFERLRVMPAQLAEYLGHPVASIDVNELQLLRGIYQAISDGDATWTEILEARNDERAPTEDGELVAGPRQAAVGAALDKAHAKLAERAKERATKAARPPQPAATAADASQPAQPHPVRMREPGED
jgi:hypothetical protein